MGTLHKFYQTLTNILDKPIDFSNENNYLDLSTYKDYGPDFILEKINYPPKENPLVDATYIIINSMREYHLTRTKIGINEFLKSFLKNINENNQKKCAKIYSNFLYEIFLYSLKDDFPYTDLLWTYLSDVFHTVSLFLVEKGFVGACEQFLIKIAAMGNISAQKRLHTSNIQHFLHTLEVRARELGFEDLANIAKNHRFNLES